MPVDLFSPLGHVVEVIVKVMKYEESSCVFFKTFHLLKLAPHVV